MRGWYGDKLRHKLASFGISSTLINNKSLEELNQLFDKGRKYFEPMTVNNNPYVIMRNTGYGYEEVYLKDKEWVEMDDTHENSVEDYIYHTTDFDNVYSINNSGLISDESKIWEVSKERNYFSEYPAYSIMWYIRNLMASGKLNDSNYNKDKFVILRVPYEKYEIEEEIIGSSEYGISYSTEDNIKTNDIEIKTKIGWIPINTYVEQWRNNYE